MAPRPDADDGDEPPDEGKEREPFGGGKGPDEAVEGFELREGHSFTL